MFTVILIACLALGEEVLANCEAKTDALFFSPIIKLFSTTALSLNHPEIDNTNKSKPRNVDAEANVEKTPVLEVREVYFPGDVVRIKANFNPKKAILVDPSGNKYTLTFFKADDYYLAEYDLESKVLIGKWYVITQPARTSFYVDFYSINASFNGSAIVGNVSFFYVQPDVVNWTLYDANWNKEDSGTSLIINKTFIISINLDPGNYTAVLETGNAVFELKIQIPEKKIEVNKLYFVNSTVLIKVNFKPKDAFVELKRSVTELEFVKKDGWWSSTFKPNKAGIYNLSIDDIETFFIVENYSIQAIFDGKNVTGEVHWIYTPPERIECEMSNSTMKEKIYVNLTGGIFSIPVTLTGNVSVSLKTGNALKTLQIFVPQANKTEHKKYQIEVRDVYFPGDSVIIKTRFVPETAYLVSPSGEIFSLNFSKRGKYAVAEFKLDSRVLLGEYQVYLDNLTDHFYVDFYSINASFNGSAIVGNVSFFYVQPDFIEWNIGSFSGKTELENGKFTVPLSTIPAGEYTVVLKCGNALYNLTIKIKEREKTPVIAYDPVKKEIVIKLDRMVSSKHEGLNYILQLIPEISWKDIGKKDISKTCRVIKHSSIEISIPADPDLLAKFGLPEEITNTEVTVKRLAKDKLRVEMSKKLDVWYRFSVRLPEGYGVKEIVGDDGRRIVNTIHINRSSGMVEGELRWYVDNGTLYFYDDPIWGYNISLTPPQPSQSIAIELAYSGPYSGGGQISAIVFPYTQGDNATTIATYDHAGRTEDNGYGNDIDFDAGSKIAIRFSSGAATREFGNWWDHLFGAEPLGQSLINEIRRDDTPLNTAPTGELESVIITKMQTPLWLGSQVNITQKVIIRDNYRWFATVYYIENVGSVDISNLRFFQGMDWNFRGSYTGDYGYYNNTYDLVYGYDSNAPPGDIQYGGYSSDLPSSVHDVYHYWYLWARIDRDALLNSNFYSGDAATALAWDRASLSTGEKWVIPVIWGLGFTFDDMINQINEGKSRLYDAGILSIDFPENNSNFNPATAGIVYFNATVALFGIVDLDNLQVIFNVTKVGGGYTYQNSTTVNLSVPYAETAKVSFPLNISSLSYGKYRISFKTNLSYDQNVSNDEKWIYINIVAFTVEPDQSATFPPGSEVFYNLSAYNYVSPGRFDVQIIRSTEGWATKIYDGNLLIAYDSDGDGIWDFIESGYDTNSNNHPDISIPLGVSRINISKYIPTTAPLGEADVTVLNFTYINDSSVYDDVMLQTSTPPPPTEMKTFYLHSDSTMNTTAPISATETQILPNALYSWYQTPPFADRFTIFEKVTINLWLSSTLTSTHQIRISLISTDGVTSTVVGTNISTLSIGTSPTLYRFTIQLASPFSFLKNEYAVLRIENIGSEVLIVNHSSLYPSSVTYNTTTYVKVVEISASQCVAGNNTGILSNVTDPIGSYDISRATIDVYYPNGTLLLSATMNLVQTDPSSPSLWKLFNYSFTVPVPGTYTVNVTGVESNGVTSTSTLQLTCAQLKTIHGWIFEDFYPLGRNTGEDVGFASAKVYLLQDDGDRILTYADRVVGQTVTNATGYYSFTITYKPATYFVTLDSLSLVPTDGLNPGYLINETWAEQTYQTEWNGTGYSVTQKFGGQNPELSDRFGVLFFDDFEVWSGWYNYSNGVVSQSSDVSFSGYYSLKKSDFNDPNGGYKLIGKKAGRDVVLEGWCYRPSGWSGGAIDRVGLENESFSGYTFRVHHSLNYISIDRRTNGIATQISSQVPWNPPEDEWYFFRLFIFTNGTIRFSTYYSNGTLAATVSTTDNTYTSFDRVVVHGGYEYYLDDLAVKDLRGRFEHVTSINFTAYNNEDVNMGFSFNVIVNVKDSDDSPDNRYAQGTLRQFITNANAISGPDRSYFVMMVNQNSNDASGSWWTIILNSSLGVLPSITDTRTEVNGTVFYPNMSPRDSNPGYVIYNYSTQSLQSSAFRSGIPVGTGSDGMPFNGDEKQVYGVPKPEIEIYGNAIVGSVLNITGTNCLISDLSVFGAATMLPDYWNYGFGIKSGEPDKSYGSGLIVKNSYIGLRANGSDPFFSGFSRNEYAGIGIYGDNTQIFTSIVAYNGGTGILFWGNGVKAGEVREVQIFRNGLVRAKSDGIAVEGWMSNGYNSRASNVSIYSSLLTKNAGFGFDSWFGKRGIRILNSTFEFNGYGNETGVKLEQGGIRILANESLIAYNLIRENSGSGIVVGRMANYSTQGIQISQNSIYNNSWLGIDIDGRLNYVQTFSGNNITVNDGLLNASQPNRGTDYPVITFASLNGSDLYIEGFIGNESLGGSPTFGGATVEIYLVKNSTSGDNLIGNDVSGTGTLKKIYGEGWIYLGSLNADSNGYFNGTINVSGKGVEINSYLSATTIFKGNTSEFGPNFKLFMHRNLRSLLNFSASGNNLSITISVTAVDREQSGVCIYWMKPENTTVISQSGDFNTSGSSGNVYWWKFDSISAGETKYVYLNLSTSGSWSLSSVFNLGVDPR
jgi:hypothetical protein